VLIRGIRKSSGSSALAAREFPNRARLSIRVARALSGGELGRLPKRSCIVKNLERDGPVRPNDLKHVPEKHALGLDPMGGNRFSEKDMRQQRDLERFPIPLNREVL
jgi:hypothetical protein